MNTTPYSNHETVLKLFLFQDKTGVRTTQAGTMQIKEVRCKIGSDEYFALINNLWTQQIPQPMKKNCLKIIFSATYENCLDMKTFFQLY